jgi:HEAT repeat protein
VSLKELKVFIMAIYDLSITSWIESLKEAAGSEGRGAAGVAPAVRRGVRTRGAIAAKPSGNPLEEVFARLFSQDLVVRQEVVRQLLQNPDELALRVLSRLAVAPGDPSADVRWSVAEGLGQVAGHEAIAILEQIARTDPEETVRTCAIGALGRRARTAYAAQAGPEAATPAAIVRTRGPVRTRGASPVRRASPEAQRILDLLNEIREDEVSDYVKQMADRTLKQLGD